MHIRPMLRDDLPAVTDIGAAAFLDDELFVHVHPRSKQNPLCWRRTLLLRLHQRMLAPGIQSWVCVLDERDAATVGPPDTIVGYCFWHRHGPASSRGKAAWSQQQAGWNAWLERSLFDLQERWIDLFNLDWSVDRQARDAYKNAQVELWETQFEEHWHLRALATHPDYRRRGVGHLLVAWGVEAARLEDIPATVEASDDGSRVYRRHGYRTVAWDAYAVEHGWLGGQALIWDRGDQPDRNQGRYTRAPVGDEAEITIGGKKLPIEVVWRNKQPAGAPVEQAVQSVEDGPDISKGP